MIIKQCIICGQSIKSYPSQTTKKCCSQRCLGKWRSQNKSGVNHPQYKGGTAIYKRSDGRYCRYMRGMGTPMQPSKYPEHRYVMGKVLGRELHRWEEVHHINGDTLDNRPENLYVVDRKNHGRIHSQLFIEVQRLERENQLLKGKLQSLLGTG